MKVAVVDTVEDTIRLLTGETVKARVVDAQALVQEMRWMKRLNEDPAFRVSEQRKRTLKAVQGRWTIRPIPDVPNAWRVRNGRNSHEYTVTLYPTGRYTCTCPDFVWRCQATPLRCKHIEAVRLWRLTN